MARISIRTGLIAAGVVAVAGVSWVSANPPPIAPTMPAAAPNAIVVPPPPAPTTSPAAKPTSTGKPVAGHGAPKAIERPAWSELNRPQQDALMPLAGEWDKLESVRKQKWLEIANHFSSMAPDEQQRVHERMREWVKLTPEQRRLVRENYARSKKIEPAKKSEQWEQYQQLPEDQKKKLAAEAAIKKQVANLPSASQSKIPPIPPIKSGLMAPAATLPPVPATAVSATTLPPVPATTAPAVTPATVPAPAATAPPASTAPVSPNANPVIPSNAK